MEKMDCYIIYLWKRSKLLLTVELIIYKSSQLKDWKSRIAFEHETLYNKRVVCVCEREREIDNTHNSHSYTEHAILFSF